MDDIGEAKEYYNEGHDYFDRGDYPNAIECFKKIHRRSDLYYFNAQLLLGLSYSAKEEYIKAKEIYGSIPKNDPNYNEAQINLAKIKEPIDMFVSVLKWLGVVIDILVILVIIFFNIATIFPELFYWLPFIEDIKEINKTNIIRLNIILFAVFIGFSLFLYNVFNSHNDVFPKTITTFINLILCAIAGLIILFAIIVLIPSDTAIPSGVAVVSDVEVASDVKVASGVEIASDVEVASDDANLTDEISLFMVQITIFIALVAFSFAISLATPYFMANAKMENIKIEAKDEAKATAETTANDIAKQQMENTKVEVKAIAKSTASEIVTQQMENTKVEIKAIAKSTASEIATQQMENTKAELESIATELIEEKINKEVLETLKNAKKMDSHLSRMIAFFLIKNDYCYWSIGWAFRSLRRYTDMDNKLKNTYDDFVEFLYNQVIWKAITEIVNEKEDKVPSRFLEKENVAYEETEEFRTRLRAIKDFINNWFQIKSENTKELERKFEENREIEINDNKKTSNIYKELRIMHITLYCDFKENKNYDTKFSISEIDNKIFEISEKSYGEQKFTEFKKFYTKDLQDNIEEIIEVMIAREKNIIFKTDIFSGVV